MFVTKRHVSRRTFLRGTLGTAIALPMLDAMVPALTAQSKTAAAPKFHFGAVYVPNGVFPDRWHPEAAGADFDMKPAMLPLERHRKHLLTVSNMVAPPGEVHLGASAAWLNGWGPLGKQGEPIQSATTLDQHIAAVIGQDTPLPSLEVGTEDMGTAVGACDGHACIYFNTLAWKNETTPLPVEINPRVTFERMFGETGSAAQRAQRLQQKKSMLDAVTAEAAALQRRLGARDKVILSEYLDNIREVERRIQQVELRTQSNVEIPAAPTGIPETMDEHLSLTYDLLHLAWQGDITRVFTFLAGVEASNRSYPQIGVPESHHNVSHHGNDPGTMAKYTKVVAYHLSHLANFIDKLKATPDGDGTLLDHAIVYYGSGMGNGNAHDRNNPPAAVIGGGNGKVKGNRHVVADKEPVANFMMNMAEWAGVELWQIGPSWGKLDL